MAPPFCPFGVAAAASPRADPVRGRAAPAPAVADAGRDVLVRPLAAADAPAVAGLAALELRVPLFAVFAEPVAVFAELVAGLAALELRVPLVAVFAEPVAVFAAPEPEPAAGFAAPDVRRAVPGPRRRTRRPWRPRPARPRRSSSGT